MKLQITQEDIDKSLQWNDTENNFSDVSTFYSCNCPIANALTRVYVGIWQVSTGISKLNKEGLCIERFKGNAQTDKFIDIFDAYFYNRKAEKPVPTEVEIEGLL